jgi:hypothetical protein
MAPGRNDCQALQACQSLMNRSIAKYPYRTQ